MGRKLIALTASLMVIAAACASDGSGADSDASSSNAAGTDTTASTASVSDSSDASQPAGSQQTAEQPSDASDDGVLEVPLEFATIQDAVTAAAEGDLVLISPGTYHEAVDVVTHNLTIRGLDRDGVILDGELTLDNGIRVLGANGVAIENLTAINYTANGLYWISASGYRASYITTSRTGDYGIYAYDSVKGQIEHSHTVGSRDAGVYIGQCFPCDAVIDDVVSSNNGLGYSGTNSGGDLLIVNSVFHHNRAGVVTNSATYELCYPQRRTTLAGNLVYSNNQTDTAAIDEALLAQGNGILISGGIGDIVTRNRVFDHVRTGIGVVPFPEEDPNDDMPTAAVWDTTCDVQKTQALVIPEGALLWDSFDNRITGNIVSESGLADIGIGSVGTDLSTLGNCWSDNEITSSRPAGLQSLAPCDATGDGGNWTVDPLDVVAWLTELASLPPEVDWKIAPLPEIGSHDSMPDAATAPAHPATDVPRSVDLDAITVPDAPT